VDYFLAAQIGLTRSLTPEGYLLCRDVPIGRIGQQEYLAHELGGKIEGDANGIVKIQRDPEEVFRPETIASFNGKPVIMDAHQMLDAQTWRGRSVGSVLNPRRSEDGTGDFLLADLMICDQHAIRKITDGLTEVSCGYTSDYEELAPGLGRQVNIVGNHLAIVERGRCGPACSIGDHGMPAPKKGNWLSRLRTAVKTGDNEAMEEVLSEIAPEGGEAAGGVSINLHLGGEKPAGNAEGGAGGEGAKEPTLADVIAALNGIGERLTKLEAMEKTEAEVKVGDKETDEEKKKREEEEAAAKAATGDSAALLTVFQEALSGAEILAPGIQLPTFDAKAAPAATTVALCTLKRNALATFLGTAAGQTWGDSLSVKAAALEGMTCDAINGLFPVAVRDQRASKTIRSGTVSFPDAKTLETYKPKTPAEMNAENRKRYGFA